MRNDEIPSGTELFENVDETKGFGRRSFLAIVAAALLGLLGRTASPASAAVKVPGRGDAKGKKSSTGHKVAGTGDKTGKKTTYV